MLLYNPRSLYNENSADKTIQLHDGRTLGFVEYGSSTGKNQFYFHGHPGSRFEIESLACKAALTKESQRWVDPDKEALSIPGMAETMSALATT